MEKNFLIIPENETPEKDQRYVRIFDAIILAAIVLVMILGCSKEASKDQTLVDPSLAAVVADTYPTNLADAVVVDPVLAVTFKSAAVPSDISGATLTLKSGSLTVAGTSTVSGTTVTFTPFADLLPDTKYTATLTTTKSGDSHYSKEHSWSFTTGKEHKNNSLAVVSVAPVSGADKIATDSKPAVTFNRDLTSALIKLITITLSNGTTPVPATVTYSGKVATIAPAAALAANVVYTGKVIIGSNEDDDKKSSANTFTWNFTTTGSGPDVTPPTVVSVVPVNNAATVAISSGVTATFSEAMTASTITTTTFTLKQGTTAVAGTVACSGSTATFTPASSLVAGTVYTATITTGAKDAAGNSLAANYTWSFTTSATADVTPPTVTAVAPLNSAAGVAVTVHPTATFSEAMTASTITTTTFTLKQGTTAVAGTVAYSGTTATFTPSAGLAAGTVYTGTITTGARDVAGNAIVSNYTWSFTTAVAADVTPPTVTAVVPLNSATGVAVTVHPTATFSEAMTASTITTTTFTLKQGTTAVAGTVAYSGTTATFTPSASLAAGTVYTGTITTGARDVAGNAIVSNYTWSFTTAAATVTFSGQVWPILQSKCMPCHGANSPSAGISIIDYASVSKLSNTQLDNSSMYSKMGVTATEQAAIKAWISAGRINN